MEHWLPVAGRRVCVQRALTLSLSLCSEDRKCAVTSAQGRDAVQRCRMEKRSHVGMDRVPGAS